ncbi:MAG: XdhC family protein [Rhodothermales bacterium]|nr:XdhC family protein [Rhodothermales bacterium]MBO6779237.1 XdhC family protein [Rhodothermales bacterium]
MRDVFATMSRWSLQETPFALARVVETWGSAPRRPGAALLVSAEGAVAGSVSGGCIESAVIQEAQACLRDGRMRFLSFGVSAETAWQVGLSCGGQISVLVQPFDPVSEVGRAWMQGLASRERVWVRTALDGSGQSVTSAATEVVAGWDTAPATPAQTGLFDGVFVHEIRAPARLLLLGGADISVHLSAMASRAGFEVLIVDPRAVFTDPERFDVAPAQILTAWPQEVLEELKPDDDTFAVLLTHDPRIDDPALRILLQADVAYVGALGGRKTREARNARLAAAGFSEDLIARIHQPVGLAIGARDPAEIAASILAELIAVRNGATGSRNGLHA